MLITAETVVTGRELLRPGGSTSTDRPARAWTVLVPARAGRPRAGCGHGGARVCGHARARWRRGTFPAADRQTESPGDAVDSIRRHGTTTMVASLVAAIRPSCCAQVRAMAEQVRSGVVAGIHLEGPWLAAERCGAHELSALRDPDPAELDRVPAAGGGTIRMVTLAPERSGGLAAIRRIVDAGASPRLGTPTPPTPRPGRRRRRRDGRHPPVQRDAAGRITGSPARARAGGGSAGDPWN